MLKAQLRDAYKVIWQTRMVLSRQPQLRHLGMWLSFDIAILDSSYFVRSVPIRSIPSYWKETSINLNSCDFVASRS